ncbi:riboflavin kinase-like protein [Parvimonas sp. oral taxon 393 str. F0440]|nr:riboflavin kinase-like protein [Parvimonas sp. oral taxon 393 str. F0440]
MVGKDYRFSKNREGNTDFIKSYMKEKSLSCTIVDKLNYGDIEISSTKIIEYIKSGKIKLANDLLGDNYSIKGKVTHGFQRGRNLGYPTANLEISFNYVMVKEGVYFTKTIVDKKEYFSFSSVGYNPTFDNKKCTIESHIFDFDGDIYGKNIELCFLERLRDNIKFNSVEELIEQLKKDEIRCRELIKNIK